MTVKTTDSKFESKILTIPNILSFARICMIPAIVWLYHFSCDHLAAGVLLFISGLTDVVDGFIARKFKMISNFGKIIDPIADKLTQTAVMVCLCLRYPLIKLPLITLVIKETFMATTGVLMVKTKKIVPGASWHGKVATVLLYGMMALHILWPDISTIYSATTILASTTMIIISFVLYGIRNICVLEK